MAESLPPQNKNAFKLASSNPFWALKKAIKCVRVLVCVRVWRRRLLLRLRRLLLRLLRLLLRLLLLLLRLLLLSWFAAPCGLSSPVLTHKPPSFRLPCFGLWRQVLRRPAAHTHLTHTHTRYTHTDTQRH